MRRYKSPEALKQWRKDNSGLTHIGLYKRQKQCDYPRCLPCKSDCPKRKPMVMQGPAFMEIGSRSIIQRYAPASYAEVERDEFLHRDHA